MSKRQMWVLNCWIWAAVWFVLGVFFFPFWLFTLVSLMAQLIPIGVPETPQTNIRHNPDEWSHRG